MILFYRALLIIILSQAFCRSIFSQAEVSSRFLLFKPGEKANGMAGAYTAASGDPWASYYNPAGLAGTEGLSFVLFRAKPFPFFNEITHQYYAVAFPFKQYAVGLSLNYYDPGKIYSPEWGSSGKRYYASLSVSFAGEYDGFMYGVSGKFLQIKQHTFKSHFSSPDPRIIKEFTFDLGIQKRQCLVNSTIIKDWGHRLTSSWLQSEPLLKGVSIGMSAQNLIGKEQAYDSKQSALLPRNFVLGVMYTFLSSELISVECLSDFEDLLPNGTDLDFIRFGAGAIFYRLLSIRGGYIKDLNDNQLSNFTYGFGVESKYLSVNLSRNKKLIKGYWGVSMDAHWPL